MGDDDAAAPRRRRQQLLHGCRGGEVEVRRRLVEQQQLGLGDQRPADRGALAQAGREVSHELGGAVGDARGVEQLLDARRPRRETVEARVELEVLAHAELAVEQWLVAEIADAAAGLPSLSRQRSAQHRDFAGGGTKQRREDSQQRRLAGPVGPEDDQRLAGRQLE